MYHIDVPEQNNSNTGIDADLSQAIEFRSFDEIQARKAYHPDLDPKSAKLETLVGWYHLRDIRCGLRDCHQLHDKGYVVRTDDGRETNIGHICGEKHFDADFKTLRNRLNKEITARFRREQIAGAQANRTALLDRVDEIRSRSQGADWLYKSLKNFKQAYPYSLIRQLTERAPRGDNIVTASRKRTGEEIENLITGNPSLKRTELQYETVRIGRLEGLDIFDPNRDVRKIVIHHLQERLRELGEIDVDGLYGQELRSWAEWASSVERLVDEAEELVSEGQLFFRSENLKLLDHLPMPSPDKEKYGRLSWNYESGTAHSRPPPARPVPKDGSIW